MLKKNLVSLGVAAALGLACVHATAAPGVYNRAIEVVGAGAVSDPLMAVEANRGAIVNRLVSDHAEALVANGIDATAFRAALLSLRADHLLAASLVSSVQEVTQIVGQAPADGTALQRFVAMTPTVPTSMASLPSAEAYVVREGDTLSIVKASQMQLGAGSTLVGYFAPATTSLYAGSTLEKFSPKDGSGSGPNSWIGYTAGSNVANATGSAVAAGTFNSAVNTNASVFAGQSNVASGVSSLVIGGFDNRATAIDSIVGAGAGNRATGARSVVVGGGYNLASGQWSFIGGGGRQTGSGAAGAAAQDHIASGDFSAIAGGQANRATAGYTFIGGGNGNQVSVSLSSVAGGNNNIINGSAYGFIGGGDSSVVSGDSAVVAGGWNNTASGAQSSIMGGKGNTASGSGSAILGGYSNVASTNSTAGGNRAKANYTGAFMWADSTALDFKVQASEFTGGGAGWVDATNTFNVRATGGAWFVTAVDGTTGRPTAGPYVAPGSGTWSVSSDRNLKEDFVAVDTRLTLEKVVALPMTTWRYKTENGVRHIGAMAQDFKQAFDVGTDDRSITTVDADGVALAAIQGLYALVKEKDAQIDELKQRLAAVEASQGDVKAMKAVLIDLLRERANGVTKARFAPDAIH